MIINRILSIISRIKTRIFHRNKPSINDIDTKLSKYVNFQSGFFIEAGANDGYCQSNTYFLAKHLQWTGLLVEGIPDLYMKCVKERPESTVVNCALVSDDYSGDTVTMHFANLMSVVDGSMKDQARQKHHLDLGIKLQGIGKPYSVDVPARTLASILDNLPAPSKIDFFSLDVEGYELEVLRGLNLDKYRPHFILVEARTSELHDYLAANNYRMIEQFSHHDYFYQDATKR